MISWAAVAIAWSPEEQKRLTVCPGIVKGNPALMAKTLARFSPWSDSGKAHPMTTSSISSTFRPGTLATASLMMRAPISSGLVSFKIPLGALPTAVLTADTTTASLIKTSLN
jgi:hypothetical protein